MAKEKLEQLLHGYRRGHEQLAFSTKLPTRDSELVNRLSDLSGSLSGAPKFASYLSIYPLPSGRYFALARTWPDPSAPRAGCVITHTLLVPVHLWSSLEDPIALNDLFALPSVHLSHDYTQSVAVPLYQPPGRQALRDSNQNDLRTFVYWYFGEGKKPIVWFGQRRAEEVLWRLLRGLWPKLRATFSACTFCLQPRTLEDRPFDLMFAPAESYSRFLKLDPENFIDATSLSPTEQGVEPWLVFWGQQLFGPVAPGCLPNEPDLWSELDEDPTAVRRLFLIKGLMESTPAEPQVLVGAMDLVESLARDSDSAVTSKQHVTERAIKVARNAGDAGDVENGLECLRLIDDRLRRTSFSRVRDTLGPTLLDAVAHHIERSPEITEQLSVLSAAGVDLNASWFGQGVFQGFRTLAHVDPEKLLVLQSAPDLAERILTSQPEVTKAFARVVAARRGNRDTRKDLLRWLASVRNPELRTALRTFLVPVLTSNDTDILVELLKDLRAEEVGTSLGALWRQTDQLAKDEVLALVIGQIARDYPSETRDWTRCLPQWTPVVAHVFAATYPPTPHGLMELLAADADFVGPQRAEILAAFMQDLGRGSYPYWFKEATRKQILLLSILLDADASHSATVARQRRKLLDEVPDLPIAHSPALLRQVLKSSRQPFFQKLLDTSMRSLIPCYVAGRVSEVVCREFQEDPVARPWFNTVELSDLRSLVMYNTSATLNWSNAWQWIAIAPAALYTREPTLLPELIEPLSRSHYPDWSEQTSEVWTRILRRGQLESHSSKTRLVLCVQALKFCFDNNSLPLSPVVVEAFHDVYAVVLRSSTLPPAAEPLFSIWDWDKGKELRRKLVDSFLHSKWPPGDLVLAVADEHLLRKVFKRIMKNPGGQRFLQAALVDLTRRKDQNVVQLASALREMLAKPNFFEEWD